MMCWWSCFQHWLCIWPEIVGHCTTSHSPSNSLECILFTFLRTKFIRHKIQSKLVNCGRMCVCEMNSERSEFYWMESSTWNALQFYSSIFLFNANRCVPRVNFEKNHLRVQSTHVLKSIAGPAPIQELRFPKKTESNNLISRERKKNSLSILTIPLATRSERFFSRWLPRSR